MLGGGAFAVIPLGERGKLPDLIPLFKGHSGPVLDTDFNPFNDRILASGSEDGKVSLTFGLWETNNTDMPVVRSGRIQRLGKGNA